MTNKYIVKIQPNWILKNKLKYLVFIYQIKNNNTLIWQECAENEHYFIFLGIHPKDIIINLPEDITKKVL